jgi:hypothetical protein
MQTLESAFMPPPYPAVYKPEIIVSLITVDGKGRPGEPRRSYLSDEGSPEGLRLPVNTNDPAVSVERAIESATL